MHKTRSRPYCYGELVKLHGQAEADHFIKIGKFVEDEDSDGDVVYMKKIKEKETCKGTNTTGTTQANKHVDEEEYQKLLAAMDINFGKKKALKAAKSEDESEEGDPNAASSGGDRGGGRGRGGRGVRGGGRGRQGKEPPPPPTPEQEAKNKAQQMQNLLDKMHAGLVINNTNIKGKKAAAVIYNDQKDLMQKLLKVKKDLGLKKDANPFSIDQCKAETVRCAEVVNKAKHLLSLGKPHEATA